MKGSVEDITLRHQVCRPCVQGKKNPLVFTLTQQLCTERKIKESCVSSRWHLSLVYFSQSFHCKPARMGEFESPWVLRVNSSKADVQHWLFWLILIPFRLKLMLRNIRCSTADVVFPANKLILCHMSSEERNELRYNRMDMKGIVQMGTASLLHFCFHLFCVAASPSVTDGGRYRNSSSLLRDGPHPCLLQWPFPVSHENTAFWFPFLMWVGLYLAHR